METEPLRRLLLISLAPNGAKILEEDLMKTNNSMESKPSGGWGFYLFSYFVYLSALGIMITCVKNAVRLYCKRICPIKSNG